MSGELLQLLHVQDSKAEYDIMTLDEPWFDLSIDQELIWLPADAPVLDRRGL
jgi:hypothetical protein